VRGKRMYAITESGREAAAHWVNHAPVEAPVLKHSVMLRAWLGNLAEPDRLHEILTEHIGHAEKMRKLAEVDAEGADENADSAYPGAVLRWCVRHYEAERDLAKELLVDVDKLAAKSSLKKAAKGKGRRVS
jgi:DNA-binding PadR family transcriptional regulator